MSTAARTTEPTRERLLTAAEELFAAHGVGGVSLREITRASGTRNTVGLQYHFKDRNGVVRAILGKHLVDVDARRHALLDQCESDGADLRTMAAALVMPSAAKLGDNDGGPEFLQIYAELVNRPRGEETLAFGAPSSLDRWRAAVAPLMDREAVRLHRRFTSIRLAASELGRRAASGPHTDDRLFVGHLIDLVTALLGAPVSEETVQLADERDAQRAGARRAARASA
ncbi:MAG: TetR/AcrR family transcriptional regulator [Acidimicrobiales bacterium]